MKFDIYTILLPRHHAANTVTVESVNLVNPSVFKVYEVDINI